MRIAALFIDPLRDEKISSEAVITLNKTEVVYKRLIAEKSWMGDEFLKIIM